MRTYYESNGTVGVLDLNLTSTLWEGAGTYEASEDSALTRVIGQAVPVVDHHILVGLTLSVSAWAQAAEGHEHEGGGLGELRDRASRDHDL